MAEYIFESEDGEIEEPMTIAGLPTITRCKDCIYGIIWGNEVECTAHKEQGYDPEPYHPLKWFCADGKTDTKKDEVMYSKTDKEVIEGLDELYKAMHKNQCYACAYEFVVTAAKFGTEIIAEAIEKIKLMQREINQLREGK